ncbi:MAG: fused response regulator/phosphatase [Azospirillaceae bacterium]|nr:fused response regulator/phosphatase [Azospirillaceae bacterium]
MRIESPSRLDLSNGDRAPEAAAILVVEDNEINRQVLIALLRRGGFSNIGFAVDGTEALALIPEFQPDLVLLDLMMPRLDGFDVCRRLRADPRFHDLPILVQSSMKRSEDRSRAFDAGATDYVTKPINALELLARIRIHLQNRALVRRLQDYRQHHETDLALARNMQLRLLPPAARQDEVRRLGLRLTSHFAPSSELGGDFWDLRILPDGRLAVWLVDFSGHGVGAAVNTFRLHTILRRMAMAPFDPVGHLAALNEKLCGLLQFGQFATVLVGVVDCESGQFSYASAGAPPPLVWVPGDDTPRFGNSAGLPIGIRSGATYQARQIPLPPGGRLLLYSDAASELWCGSAMLGEDGLARIATEAGAQVPDDRFLSVLVDRLAELGPMSDDLTLLVLSRDT